MDPDWIAEFEDQLERQGEDDVRRRLGADVYDPVQHGMAKVWLARKEREAEAVHRRRLERSSLLTAIFAGIAALGVLFSVIGGCTLG